MSRPKEDRCSELFSGSTYTRDELEFLQAIDRYKRTANRRFLSWREVLRIAKGLGYQKILLPRARRRRIPNSC